MAKTRIPQSVVILLQWRRSPLALYAAGFLFCMQDGILMIALPWRIMALKGGSAAVGAIGGAWMAGYILFCLLIGPHADRLGVRRLVMVAAVTSTCLIAFMPAAPAAGLLLAMVAMIGASAGMFWPPLTGWLSVGQEGSRLNKRLGTFSFSWGAGLIAGSLLGGPLWEIHPTLAFAAAASTTLGAFLVAAGARKRHPPAVQAGTAGTTEAVKPRPEVSAFHRMALVAGIIGGMANGVVRYPIVALMKSMSLGPNVHGLIATGISIALICGLYLMGRTTRWHYKHALLWGSQIVMAAGVCAVAFGRTGWELAICAIAVILCVAVVFASDVYYSLSGSTRRAASMASRGIRVAIGFAIGSFGGGALGRLFSLRTVYPVMAAIIVAAVVAQMAVYYRSRRGTAEKP